MNKLDTLPQYYPPTRKDWRKWLQDNHKTSEGVWLVFFKKETGKPTITYDEAVEEALCFGWIDSIGRKLDAERHMLLISPRKPKSPWSRLNKNRLEKIYDQGLMTPAGQIKIDQAKKDGSWSIYDPVEDMIIPEELTKLLNKNKTAKENFEATAPSMIKAILWWIYQTPNEETRMKRIQKLVEYAERNENPLPVREKVLNKNRK